MRFPRRSGILLHPTSLPGQFGIGDLGHAAYRFVDFLAASGQSYWQVLPLSPTGYADSPYQTLSAFAGNPMLISPQKLVAAGHLAAGEKLSAGERVILGGHNLPVPQAFRLICETAGRRPPLFTVPRWLVETIGQVLARIPIFMLQDHMTTLHCWQPLNTARMERILDIRPRPFEETVRDALDWYRERGYI